MADPKRVQLKRSKGWRMPPNTVKVDRSTKWGNRFVVGQFIPIGPAHSTRQVYVADAATAVRLFRRYLPLRTRLAAKHELRGKNIACWCGEHDPCHGDAYIEIANG